MNRSDQIRSRLPKEDAFWDGLTSRIMSQVRSELPKRRSFSWDAILDQWAPGLGVAAAVAVLLTVVWLPPAPVTVANASIVERALGPVDELGALVITSASPPDAVQLLGVAP